MLREEENIIKLSMSCIKIMDKEEVHIVLCVEYLVK